MATAHYYQQLDVSDGDNKHRSDGGDMGKPERRELVLDFLRENPLAMPPLLIYRNLRLHRGITFSKDSVRRYLDDLAEEGKVRRIKKQPLEDRELIEAEKGDRAYYIISEQGLEPDSSD